MRVRFTGGELEAEQVLVATGRRPNTTDLGLEQAGVAMSRGAIAVDHQLRTNVDGVYAIWRRHRRLDAGPHRVVPG